MRNATLTAKEIPPNIKIANMVRPSPQSRTIALLRLLPNHLKMPPAGSAGEEQVVPTQDCHDPLATKKDALLDRINESLTTKLCENLTSTLAAPWACRGQQLCLVAGGGKGLFVEATG